MARRSYGQFCGLARALEIVGERWALLVVRDLVLNPKRFTDLRQGLPKIPTNILSARLKELEAAGVVQRRVLPRPASAVVYELTDYGRELEDIVLALGRWGEKSLGPPAPEDTFTAESMVLALRATFVPEAAAGVRVSYELRLGEVVLHARIEDGTLNAADGPLDGADLVISSGSALAALMSAEISPRQAIDSGEVDLDGDPALLDRFVELFRIPRAAGVA